VEEVASLKQQPGRNMLVSGSISLAQALMEGDGDGPWCGIAGLRPTLAGLSDRSDEITIWHFRRWPCGNAMMPSSSSHTREA